MHASYSLGKFGEATGVTVIGIAMGVCLNYSYPSLTPEHMGRLRNHLPITGDLFGEKIRSKSSRSGENFFADNISSLRLAKVVTHLKNYDTSHERKKFLTSIIEDFIGEDNGSIIDGDVKPESLAQGLIFLQSLPINYRNPTYDIHPDKEFSFVWSIKNGPILSLAFSTDGLIRYAYFSPSDNERVKGQTRAENISFSGTKRANNALSILLDKMGRQDI
ncbi:MAG TPA: hypothetical protein PLX33_00905 [Alphaproteobacteria bacterium]|nr:hypothetical protein [Alphaproteobacteria bacterium]